MAEIKVFEMTRRGTHGERRYQLQQESKGFESCGHGKHLGVICDECKKFEAFHNIAVAMPTEGGV